MGIGYSLDLRDRVARAVVGGETVRAVSARFEVCVASVVRWSGLYRANGSAKMGRQGRPSGGGILAPYVDFLAGEVEAKPDVTLCELANMLEKKYGLRVALGSVWRLLCKAGFTYKKQLMASECRRVDVIARRRDWVNNRQPAIQKSPARVVFIDETSVNTKMVRLRGRAKDGKRLKGSAPFGHWVSQTFVAGLKCDGLIAPGVIEGAMD